MMTANVAVTPKLIFLTVVTLFVLALLPRVLGLGTFLTVDERLWWGRSRDFIGGVIDSNYACEGVVENDATAVLEPAAGFACTLRAAHPGVITMWSGGLGIWLYYLNTDTPQSLVEFVQTLGVEPIDKNSIPWIRLPTAILFSFSVAALFVILLKLLQREKYGYWIALISAIFVALSPFSVSLSRVLHTDGVETVFVMLALLTAFYYWIHHNSRGWLLLSGVLAGAAFVAKSPAMFLMPFMALLGGWYLGKQWFAGYRGTKIINVGLRIFFDGILWLVTSAITVILLWPALWVIPKTAIDFFLNVNFGYATRGHEKGNFFLGIISNDPGMWFYPVNWLLHVTPLILAGVLLGLFFWIKGQSGKKAGSMGAWLRQRLGYGPSAGATEPLFLLSLLFAVLFTLFISLSTKKQDRYLLPVYPTLHIVAATGWAWLGIALVPKFPQWFTARLNYFSLLTSVIVLAGIAALVLNSPYYFTYFNPLAGGLKTASQITTVGWGEGLEQAAEYLNEKDNAKNLRVVSWYGAAFTPFFHGDGDNYFEQKGKALGSDYVVVYVNQKQRQLPDVEFFNFLETQFDPEKVISVNGLPFVWIYPGLGLDHYLEYERYEGVAELLGWEYTTPGIDPDHPVLSAGDTLSFDLWWEYLGKPPEEAFFLWLVGADGQRWAEAVTHLNPTVENFDAWQPGKIVPETGQLVVPLGTPPGDYTIYIGFYPETPDNPEQVLLFGLGDNPRTVTIQKPETHPEIPFEQLSSIKPILVDTGPLRLAGQRLYQLDMQLDRPFELDLYWQVLDDVTDRYQINFALLDEAGIPRWEWEKSDPVQFYPTTEWEKGEVVRSRLSVRPTAQTPGGKFQLALNIYQAEKLVNTVPLQLIAVPGRERQFTTDAEFTPVNAEFDGGIKLLGYNAGSPPPFYPGDELNVALFFQPQLPLETDYTIFVQLLGPDGQVYGQMDTQPNNGEHPTRRWTPGEIVQDRFAVTIADNAPPGEYRLITGLYQFETGKRLAVAVTGEDYVLLEKINLR